MYGFTSKMKIRELSEVVCILTTLVQIGRCLQFTEEPQSAVVEHHAEVTLRCRTDNDNAVIRWLFEGEYVANNPATHVQVNGGDLHITSFKFKPKDGSHTGEYRCEATSSDGTLLSQEALLEKAVIHHFDEDSSDLYINVTEGNVALIPCTPPRGRPDSVTTFRFKDSTIDRSTGRYLLLPSGNLQIGTVRQSDQGAYRCIAVNPVTHQIREAPHLVHLRVIAPISNSMTRFTHAEKQRVEVVAGSNLTLECVAEGSPVPLVSWNKYGGQLPENRFKMALGNLIILDVQRHDAGTYICSCDNGIGSLKTTVVHVDILEPPVFLRGPEDQVANVGGTVTIGCLATGYPSAKTEWLHNGKEIPPNDHLAITDTSLTITNLQASHAGIYQCMAYNKLGRAYSHSHLSVLRSGERLPEFNPPPHDVQDIAPDMVLRAPHPTITSRPVNMSVMTGDTIVIPCSVPDSIAALVKLTWSRDGKPLDSDFQGHYQGHGHRVAPSGALQLFNVRPSDSGRYVCSVSNEAGQVTMVATLSISETSRRSTPGPESKDKVRLEDGESTSYDDGILGGVLPSRGRDRPGRRSKKRGREEAEEDEEEEDVDTPNPGGDKMVPPSRPEVTKLSDSSVMLRWDVPENDGLPIMFFKVQYKQINADGRRRGWRTIDDDIRQDQFVYEVSGLQPGGVYKFRVLAVYSNNDNKQGRTSKKFELTIPRRPNSCLPTNGPIIVKVRPASPQEMNLEWQYIPEEQCAIEGFIVYYRRYQSGEPWVKQPILGAAVRQFSVSALQPKTHYSFKMQTFNSEGPSEDSNQVVQETLGFDEPGVKTGEHVDEAPVLGGMPTLMSHPSTTEDYSYMKNNMSTQKSSELLYMVVGIVLGIMMLLLLLFMAMCAWKHRQQRRMLSEINAMRKFDDPSKTIYNDSLHKKQNGITNGSAFLLGSIQPTMTQQNGVMTQQNGVMNGGNRLHITPNPMEEADTRHSGHNLQDMLPPPPPTMPPAFPSDTHYHNGTADRSSGGRFTPQPGHGTLDRSGSYTPQHSDNDQSTRVIDPSMYTVGSRHSDPKYNDTGIYYSLNRNRSIEQPAFMRAQDPALENPYAQRNPQFDRLTLPRRNGSPIVPVPPVVPPMRMMRNQPSREFIQPLNTRGRHESDSSESSSEELIERLNNIGLMDDGGGGERMGLHPLVRPVRDDSDSDEQSELYPPPSPIDNSLYPSNSPTPPPYLPPSGLPRDNCKRGKLQHSAIPSHYNPSDIYHTETDSHIYQDIPSANDYPPSDS